MIESFYTISRETSFIEFKEKGSRFISAAYPVKNEEEVTEIVNALWKEHYNATHICYAWRIGEGKEELFRYNDNGEPSGTAGLPIYNSIIKEELFNILVVSIRYFGGTKLGTGGLVRAYSQSASLALETVERLLIEIKIPFTLNLPFDFTGDIMYLINQIEGIEITNQNYNNDGLEITVKIPVASVESFDKMLIDKSRGRYSIK